MLQGNLGTTTSQCTVWKMKFSFCGSAPSAMYESIRKPSVDQYVGPRATTVTLITRLMLLFEIWAKQREAFQKSLYSRCQTYRWRWPAGRSACTHLIIYTGHSLETEKHTALTVTVGHKEIWVKRICCLPLQSCQCVAFKASWCFSFGFGESYNKSFYDGLILYILGFMCSWSFWKNILYVNSWEDTRSVFLIVSSSSG